MIFTFYSFKGGVGRSMAMAGVAHLLARRGLRVLAIDFDLEAPGLERYFFDGERSRAVRAQPGLIDLVGAYRQALTSEAAFAQGDFKRWQKFCLTAIHTTGVGRGAVDLMTAGRREPASALRDYALAVRSFDWQDFFSNWKGDLFFDWLRRQLVDAHDGYDVVLVDSRTGVTEMGGVCTYQLADAVVLLCAPNYQNLDGTRQVVDDFRSPGVLALRRGKPLDILALPARVEPDHPKRAQFLDDFSARMGVDGLPLAIAQAGLSYRSLALPYLPEFAVAERLVGEPQADAGAMAPPIEVFERLAAALTLLAPADSALGRQRDEALRLLAPAAPLPKAEAAATAPRAAATLQVDPTLSSAGFDAFIDYAAADAALAVPLRRHLEGAGLRVFADDALAAGDNWQDAAAQALQHSRALLLCFGAPSANEWRAQRVAQARRLRDVAIVPLLLPGSEPRALASFDLAQAQAVDLRDWPADAAGQRLVDALRAAARGAARPPAAGPGPASAAAPPYPGARAFGEDDAAQFCGRDHEADALLGLLAGHGRVWLAGPAQVGKTSLVCAGVLPRLRRAAAATHIVVVDCASAAPLPAPARLFGAAAPGATVLVIDGIDSFAGDGSAAARAARLAWLHESLHASAPGDRLLLVGRDSLPPTEQADLAAWLAQHGVHRYTLAPLQGEALREAIEQPARRAGHLLEPGLTERLVDSAGASPGAIAQIQRALAVLWPERRRGWLTNQTLDAAGHLAGLFGERRRAFWATLSPPQREAADALVARLVTLTPDYALIAKPAPWALLATMPVLEAVDATALRDTLAGHGLIDLYSSGHAASSGGAPIGQSPADAAATEPPPVDNVMLALPRGETALYFGSDGSEGNASSDGSEGSARDLPFLLWREPLALAAARRPGDSEQVLLRGAALAEAQDHLARHHALLTAPEREFIEASAHADQRRRQAEQAAEQAQARERLAAAEALAAEQGARAQAEADAAQRHAADAAQLRRSRRALQWLVLVSLLFGALALWRWQAEHQARQAEQQARRLAEDAQQKAQAESLATKAAAQNAEQALRSAEAALASARSATGAATQALSAATPQQRDDAQARLQQAKTSYEVAASEVSKAQDGCPTGRWVYLQIADESDRDAARQRVAALTRNGFSVPGIERVAKSPSGVELRYFRRQDADIAALAAKVLADTGVRAPQTRLLTSYENRKDVRPCLVEAWFGAGAFDAVPARK